MELKEFLEKLNLYKKEQRLCKAFTKDGKFFNGRVVEISEETFVLRNDKEEICVALKQLSSLGAARVE